MRKIYVPLAEENKFGKMYDEFEIPNEMPLAPDWVTVAPPNEYKYPYFDFTQMKWLEDKDRVITELKSEIEILKETTQEGILETQVALVEVYEMIEKERGI